MKKIFSNVLVGALSAVVVGTAIAKDNTNNDAIAAELAKLNSDAVVTETKAAETDKVAVAEEKTVEAEEKAEAVKEEIVKEEKVEAPQQEIVKNESEPEVFAPRMVSEPTEPSNPEIAFPRGLQIGAGLSVTSGVNGFIG